MDERRRSNFELYCNSYRSAEDNEKYKIEQRAYEILSDADDEMNFEGKNSEKLLDVLMLECGEQYKRRSEMYTRVGIVMGLWGVLVAAMMQNASLCNEMNIIKEENVQSIVIAAYFFTVLKLVLTVGIVASFILSIRTRRFGTISFEPREKVFLGAADDRAASMTFLIDAYLNQFEFNAEIVQSLHRISNLLNYLVTIWVCVIIIENLFFAII